MPAWIHGHKLWFATVLELAFGSGKVVVKWTGPLSVLRQVAKRKTCLFQSLPSRYCTSQAEKLHPRLFWNSRLGPQLLGLQEAITAATILGGRVWPLALLGWISGDDRPWAKAMPPLVRGRSICRPLFGELNWEQISGRCCRQMYFQNCILLNGSGTKHYFILFSLSCEASDPVRYVSDMLAWLHQNAELPNAVGKAAVFYIASALVLHSWGCHWAGCSKQPHRQGVSGSPKSNQRNTTAIHLRYTYLMDSYGSKQMWIRYTLY